MDTFLLGVVVVGAGPTVIYGIPQVADVHRLDVTQGFKDYSSGVLGTGRGRVRATVKEKGTPNAPVYRKVRLIREVDGLVIRTLWTDPITGAYDFQYVDELQAWTVVSYDHLHNFRAVVADNLTLANGGVELMP